VRKLTTPFDMIASLLGTGHGTSDTSESRGGTRGLGRGRGSGELSDPELD